MTPDQSMNWKIRVLVANIVNAMTPEERADCHGTAVDALEDGYGGVDLTYGVRRIANVDRAWLFNPDDMTFPVPVFVPDGDIPDTPADLLEDDDNTP
ncbi:hypothetical protein CJ179_50205 [Rhodococcus sp. ACS1]|nr:hypothetical protein CJ179_50205 [Rhodococcus sp. ACS1]